MARWCGDHIKSVQQPCNQVCTSAGITATHQWATSMTPALLRCLHANFLFLLDSISQQVNPFLSFVRVCFSARNHSKIKGHSWFFKTAEAVCWRLAVPPCVSHRSCFDTLNCQSRRWKVKASCTSHKSSFWVLNHPESDALCSCAAF